LPLRPPSKIFLGDVSPRPPIIAAHAIYSHFAGLTQPAIGYGYMALES